jgi:hypothetical protein
LIDGPGVFICDECVGVCGDIIAHETRDGVDERSHPSSIDDASNAVELCSLCGAAIGADDGVPIVDRGLLCVECLRAVEEVIRERPPND